MTRTTIDLDPSVLRQLKERGRTQGKTVGTVASELLAASLAAERTAPPEPLRWRSKPLGALVDIDDKEALWRVLDQG